ncbi:MAG: cation transporter [Tannerella sp.]|jgi:Cu(I)/Ag(I) efflux system membrane fusion protein|nr:cation transporter [Tannerella sp.]
MKRIVYLIAAVALAVSVSACSGSASNRTADSNASGAESEASHAMLAVNGGCGMCKKKIETAAKSVEGVSVAEWSLEDKELHLHFDASQTSLNAISEVIAKIGYDTELNTAPDEAYNALPECCQYRK